MVAKFLGGYLFGSEFHKIIMPDEELHFKSNFLNTKAHVGKMPKNKVRMALTEA